MSKKGGSGNQSKGGSGTQMSDADRIRKEKEERKKDEERVRKILKDMDREEGLEVSEDSASGSASPV